MKIFVFIFAAGFLTAAHAHAAPDAGAFSLFEAGDYEASAEKAAAAGGAENLALSARALNARAYLEADNKTARKLARRALNFADAAVGQDPSLIEGHLQGAISLAQRGARMAPVRAFISGTAGKARDRLDAALDLDPENAWALSSSAAWHLEVSRRGGEGSFGSDPELGYQQFLAARAADPENPVIAYEAALRIIAYDRPDWRGEGLDALAFAVEAPARDAFERAIQSRAKAFQTAISEGQQTELAFIDAQP